MRLFVGVFLPDAIQEHLENHRRSHPALPGLRWIPPISRHVTLKFIGQASNENVPIFQSVLNKIAPKYAPLNLWCESGGVFPSRVKPRVFWTGIGGDTHVLSQMARELEDEFGQLGFPPENRRYSPHLTLARWDQGGEALVEGFEKIWASYHSPDFVVSEIHLIQSQLSSRGSTYQILASLPLSLSVKSKIQNLASPLSS